MTIPAGLIERLSRLPISQEQKNGILLEAIFSPEARRARDRLYVDADLTNLPRFVHYTSADAALKILRSRRIWMRNTTCMVDFREVQHGYDMLLRFFQSEERKSLEAAIDGIFEGVFEESVKVFDSWWGDIRLGSYVASLSEHDASEDINGRLSMWRAFGGNSAGPRVAIVIRPPAFSQALGTLRLFFSPVAYVTEPEAKAILDEVRTNVLDHGDYIRTLGRQNLVGQIFNMLLGAVTCVKHEGFVEEREWRAIYSPRRNPSSLMETTMQVVSGVPQPVCLLPLDERASSELQDIDLLRILDRVIIGPTQFPAAVAEAFRMELEAAGLSDPSSRIFASMIPLRT